MKTGISYFGVRNPEWVSKDMKSIKEAGFKCVLHTFSEEDLQYYPQTMKEIIAASKSEGLEVYVNPWGVGRVFGGEAYSELAARDGGMAQVSFDGKPLVAACPNSQGFREYMKKWIKFVCESEATTVFWDEPHFYFEKNKSVSACRCPNCLKLYKEQNGEEMPNTPNEKIDAFKRKSLLSFLSFVTEEVHKLGKKNSVCLLPPWFMSAGLDNWEEVASLPYVDEIGSDPYWEKGDTLEKVTKYYGDISRRLADLAKVHKKEAQIWVKNYGIEAGTEHFVKEATQIAIKSGVKNIFAWSYQGSKYMDTLRCDNPKLVWQTQIKTLSLANAFEY